MDQLHSVLRSLRPVQKKKRDHLTVFREFLSHLDRVSKQGVSRDVKARKSPRKRRSRG